ncbi:MAG TPA: MFS transporter [Candidatus Pacearchaeota archaeon]|nr:MFS transporter [Candidatus Pacearchaeota archaeon]
MKIRINKIIKSLLFSDLAFYTGWGLISPLFALFILERINGASPFAVGMATAIYWLTFSLVRIPFGVFLDKTDGESDDYWFMILGLIVASLVPFSLIAAREIWQVYLAQFFHGLGIAMSVSGWTAIFHRHIDKTLESTEYGVSGASIAVATALSAIIGGWAIQKWGFDIVLVMVGILGILGVVCLWNIEKDFRGGFHPVRIFKRLSQREFWNDVFLKSGVFKGGRNGKMQ